MSLHKSLKINKWTKGRAVRKRVDRIAKIYNNLIKGGLSEEEAQKQLQIYGLPKEKVIRLKTPKKEKEEKKEESGISTGYGIGGK